MKTKNKTSRSKGKVLFALLALSLSMISCEKNDPSPEEEILQNCNVVLVEDNIEEPTTWTYGNVYVIKSNIVVRNVLTIEPGVIVKLKDASMDIVGGKILAKGTAQRRIVFTSIADDRYCGDNNGDGTATTPAKGDWQQIYLNGTTETTFQYVDIFYAGKNRGGSSNAVRVSGPSSVSFAFDNCRIAHTLYQESSYDSSCAFYGSSSMMSATVSKFTNNALYDNGKPMQMNVYYTLDPSNKFHNPENPSQTNTHNGIYIHHSSGGLDVTVNWNNTEVPYVLDEWHQLHPSATIHIGANVVVKFKRPTAGINSRYGNVHLNSAAFLTSYKDDTHGGDTNGDGNNSVPAIGDWAGFSNTDVYTEWINGFNILYAAN